MSLKSKIGGWVLRREINQQVKEKTVVGKVWTWLSGKKLVIGALISVLSDIVTVLPVLLPVVIKDANTVVHVIGFSVTALGLAHKAYKYLYHEELKKVAEQLNVPVPKVEDIANVQDVKK